MTSLPPFALLANRRLGLWLLSGWLAVVLACWTIPNAFALRVVSAAGYWMVLLGFGLWVWALARSFGGERPRDWWRRVDGFSVAVVFFGGVLLLAHERFGFKIIMDEVMLLGTSMAMHFDRTVLTPQRGNDIQGAFVIIEGILDKRPLFFPFLVSVVHDVSGYRPTNVFLVNGLLTFVFLGLVAVVGRQLAGRLGTCLGVGLFAGLPLLGQNCTGGGFELLNMVMILVAVLLGARYLEKRDEGSLVALVYAGLLLIQVRYESALFLLPLGGLICWVWCREGRVQLPWELWLAPWLLLHVPLHLRVFAIRTSAWEMASKPGYTGPFSVSYIPDNLGHAAQFFFGSANQQPNSWVLSGLGVIAVLFFILWAARRWRSLAAEPALVAAIAIFSGGFGLHFALMMGYAWRFDEVVTRRLSLPTQLGMVLVVLVMLTQFRHALFRRGLLVVVGVGLLARSVPSMAAHAYSQEYSPGRETAWRRAFIAAQPRSDYLMIDNDATLWVTHLVSATPTLVAQKRKVDIAFHMRNRTFAAVYVFQHFSIDPETGVKTVRAGDELEASFKLETVMEERLQLLNLVRISRVTEILEGAEVLSTLDEGRKEVPKDQAVIGEARRLFMESYFKHLP